MQEIAALLGTVGVESRSDELDRFLKSVSGKSAAELIDIGSRKMVGGAVTSSAAGPSAIPAAATRCWQQLAVEALARDDAEAMERAHRASAGDADGLAYAKFQFPHQREMHHNHIDDNNTPYGDVLYGGWLMEEGKDGKQQRRRRRRN